MAEQEDLARVGDFIDGIDDALALLVGQLLGNGDDNRFLEGSRLGSAASLTNGNKMPS